MLDPVTAGTTASTNFSINNATADGNLGNLTNLSLLSASITGPDAARFSLGNFNPNTVLTAGANQNLSLQFNGVGAASGNYSATLTFTTDQGAAFGSAGQQFSITLSAHVLTAPTAHAGGPYTVNAGSYIVLNAGGSTGDITSYLWDLNNDGTYETSGVSPTFTGVNAGVYTIGLETIGPVGTSTDTTTVTVANVPPTAGISGPTSVLRGSTQTYTLTAVDSPADMTAGFTFSIIWGDGSPLQQVTGTSGTTVTHAFNGASTISVTATDQGGLTSTPATLGVTTSSVLLLPNAQNASLTDLVWGGTSGDDHVQFQQVTATSIRVIETEINGAVVNTNNVYTGITGRVLGSGDAGNDTVDASGLLTTQATLDGGPGSNTILGGQAGDILSGGTNGAEGQPNTNVIVAGNGNNTIYGNAQVGAEGSTGTNNLIIGGTGNDTIYGTYQSVVKGNGQPSNGGEGGQNLIVGNGGADTIYASQQNANAAEGGHGSILIAGTTNLNEAALMSVLNEWKSADTQAVKIAAITGTPAGSLDLNGSNYLIPGTTVFDNGAIADTLYSDTAGKANWLFYDFNTDTANRVKGTDVTQNLN
jgi:hypothetical protein